MNWQQYMTQDLNKLAAASLSGSKYGKCFRHQLATAQPFHDSWQELLGATTVCICWGAGLHWEQQGSLQVPISLSVLYL